MPNQPLFQGLVFDEFNHPADTAVIGDEPCYVVDDAGFKRHIPSEQVDRQVLNEIARLMKGSEDLISKETAKMIGQEDVFTKAAIEQQLRNIDKQFDQLMKMGIPEDMRAYLGMMGFKVVINIHGEVLSMDQPGTASGEDE